LRFHYWENRRRIGGGPIHTVNGTAISLASRPHGEELHESRIAPTNDALRFLMRTRFPVCARPWNRAIRDALGTMAVPTSDAPPSELLHWWPTIGTMPLEEPPRY